MAPAEVQELYRLSLAVGCEQVTDVLPKSKLNFDIKVPDFDIEGKNELRYRSFSVSKISKFDIGVQYRRSPISKLAHLLVDIENQNLDILVLVQTYRT